jgi:hypothetical protein
VTPVPASPSLVDALTITGGDENHPSIPLTGLLLFQSQLHGISHHPLASNPLFLRLLLRSLSPPLPLTDQFLHHRATYWAVHRGYSLWKILEDLESVDNVEQLYHLILSLFEKGFHFTSEHAEEARQLCLDAGSLDGLRAQHPWHSAFQNSLQPAAPGGSASGSRHRHHSAVSPTDLLGVDFRYSSVGSTGGPDPSMTAGSTPGVGPNSRSHRHGSVVMNPNATTALTGAGGLSLLLPPPLTPQQRRSGRLHPSKPK